MATLTIKNRSRKASQAAQGECRTAPAQHQQRGHFLLGKGSRGHHRVDPKKFLAEVDAMRKRMPYVNLTEEFLRAAKNEGRP